MATQEKLALDAAVDAAWAVDGYVAADGLRDQNKVRAQIVDLLAQRKVLSKADKQTKGITEGAMVAMIFPSLPGPDQWADQDDRDQAEAVWSAVKSWLWSQCATGATGPIQRLVGLQMGNGYVLCRATFGQDRVNGCYVTDDAACIQEDYVRPIHTNLERSVSRARIGIELVMLRKPELAQGLAKGLESRYKAIGVTMHQQLTQTQEAASPRSGTSPDEED